jgi:hypothetical protein
LQSSAFDVVFVGVETVVVFTPLPVVVVVSPLAAAVDDDEEDELTVVEGA